MFINMDVCSHTPSPLAEKRSTAAGSKKHPRLLVCRQNAAARLPLRATPGAAGYDLFAAENACVEPGKSGCVSTGLVLVVPESHYGRVASRSSVALIHNVDVIAGVIDADYRGVLCVCLHNRGTVEYHISTGDRIAQLIIEKVSHPEICEVETLPAETNTRRGQGGFGSTNNSVAIAAGSSSSKTALHASSASSCAGGQP